MKQLLSIMMLNCDFGDSTYIIKTVMMQKLYSMIYQSEEFKIILWVIHHAKYI